jgi:prepilin-type N-terminal cleavage/methylation domain-containing protein
MKSLLKSYTLVELMVVILILSIIAGVAIPVYNKVVDDSKAGTAQNTLRLVKHAKQTYQTEQNYDLVILRSDVIPTDNSDNLWSLLQLMNPNKVHQGAGYTFYTEDSDPKVLGVAERSSDGKKYKIYTTGDIAGDSGLPPVD